MQLHSNTFRCNTFTSCILLSCCTNMHKDAFCPPSFFGASLVQRKMPFKKKKKSANSNGGTGRRVGRPSKRLTKIVNFRYNSSTLSEDVKREYESSPVPTAADDVSQMNLSSRPQSHLGRKRRQFSAVDPELIKGLEAPHILLSKMRKYTLEEGQFEEQNEAWLDSCQKLALYFHEYRKVYVALEQRKRDLRNHKNDHKNDWDKDSSRSVSLEAVLEHTAPPSP